METNRLICTVAVALTLSSFSVSAQMHRPSSPEGRPRHEPQEGRPRPEHHQMALTPRQRAEQYETWRKLHRDPSGFFFE